MELTYAFGRPWAIESVVVDRYPIIASNWSATQRKIEALRARLGGVNIPGLRCVCAAGSLGRMEYGEKSDADLIVIVHDDVEKDAAQIAYDALWRALEPERLDKPNPKGVFASPVRVADLCGPAAGGSDETIAMLGKRLLFLLESQPLYGDKLFEGILETILEHYGRNYVARDPKKEWTFLLNDLIRYFRSVCVHYQWSFEQDAAAWRIRNVKLRHSRVVMYAGLLLLLGECSKERKDKTVWLRDRLRLTPLERIAHVYECNADWNFHRLAGSYDLFLGRLNDPELRHKLTEEERQDSYRERYLFRPYAELKATSDAIAAELTRFVLARRGSWTERFFEYLVI